MTIQEINYDEFIFYSRVSSIDSLHINASPIISSQNSPVQLIRNVKNVVALAIDYENKRLFFSDIFYKSIKQSNFDGTNILTLVLGTFYFFKFIFKTKNYN